MTINLQQMLDIIQHHSGRQLNSEQQAVVSHPRAPLWVIAGPGSGKTEVLVLRCLNLTCVGSSTQRVPPKSIILTTFTEKAAKNIQDRLFEYKSYLDEADSQLKSIDLFQLRIGTLHSLCNDIMQEYRYERYQNYRLLDEMDQLLFINEHSVLAKSRPNSATYLPLWQHFNYLIDNTTGRKKYDPITQKYYRWYRQTSLPARWWRRDAANILFNRLVEDRININQMKNKGGIWTTLANAYEEYRDALENNLSCDFAHLQLKFIDFLSSPNGARFVDGDGSQEHPGVQHILVDEYQDTNLIQESIYLELARNLPHNLCVVGDDDQALYRFRGGTVECMVNFDTACQRAYGNQIHVTQQPLSTNYRSHPDIVNWCDNYIRSFAIMNMQGARVPNKPNLIPEQNWATSRRARGAVIGNYPSVSYLVGQGQGQKKKETKELQETDVVNKFADLVEGLLNNGIIQDPSQSVLLLRSTQVWSAGIYQNALENRGIEVYNPRNRTFLEQPEIQTALGALITILDPNQVAFSTIKRAGIQNIINNWLNVYNQIASNYPNLVNYINQATTRIAQIPTNQNVNQLTSQGVGHTIASIQDIFYHLMSFEPFVTWQQDPIQTIRLGKLSKVLESYCSLPFPNSVGSTRGNLKTDAHNTGQIKISQLTHIYYSFIGLLVSGGLNDPEEEEIICPPGKFPIMTVHQAKGLEFPFVFVSKLGIQNVTAGSELQLEDALRQFRMNPASVSFNAQQRAEQDYIRFFYVAYSRAECALISLTTADELGQQGLGFGGYGQQWFTQQTQQLS